MLENFSLEIPDHEFVVLVGPPKCGLSSIVRMIAGLEQVSNGDIFVGERCVNGVPPKDREIAFVPQSYVSYPGMRVRDNLALGLTLRKFPNAEIKKRVAAAGELMGLQELLEHKPEALPSEQRQRLAIARAIALHPKAILFDEALSNLEAKAGAQVRHEVMKLHQRLRTTMIYATHDPIEAQAMGGDRLIVMKDGVIQQDGTALSIYDEPVNAFVAEFVGPAMNLVEGTLKQDRDSLVFSERDEGTIELRLPISEFPGARDLAVGPILLGIRPGDIQIADSASTPGENRARFRALVELIEPMGPETGLYLQTGAHTLVCWSDRQMGSQDAGHRAQFEVNTARVRLFDPISRKRVV